MNINFTDFKLGRKQQVGVMSVYPLLAGDVDTKIAEFEDVKFKGTSNYGTMTFNNKSEFPFIVPSGYVILTKQKAQDHCIPFASLIKPTSTRRVEQACCVQQTQAGLIDGSKIADFDILPFFIRKKHLEEIINNKNENNDLITLEYLSYDRLWDHISNFQKDLVKKQEGNLIYFFDKFMDTLTQFNAEFEVIDGQRGALIMLNDKIVGIEIAPTHAYWKSVWNNLIRDCYGSEVIRRTKFNLIKEFEASQKLDFDVSQCKSIEEIKDALNLYYSKDSEHTSELLLDFSNKEFLDVKENDVIDDNSFSNISYHIVKAKNENVYGELYQDEGNMIYCSLLF